MQKKKIINFRPLFYCFISYSFAIVFASKLFFEFFAYAFLFLALFIFFLLFSIYKKTFLQFSLCAIAMLLGLSSFLFTIKKYNTSQVYDSSVIISGSVSNVKQQKNFQQVVLSNVKIDQTSKTFSVVFFDYESSFSINENIEFQAELNKVSLFNLGKFSSFYYDNDILYSASYKSENVLEKVSSSPTFKEKVKQNTLNSFLKTMPKDIAHIAYGAMFGDTSGISSDVYSSFRDSGIIHILSVSGMHMVIVVGIVDFFLRKLKLNKYLKFSIFAFFLLLYSYLCSFNVTVVRSCIMSLLLIFGTSFGKRYDMLNAIGISGLFILLFRPLLIFDVGFQLSYLSVFMISAFAKPIGSFLQKKGVPQKLSIALGVSLAVQIGILPLTLKYFGQFPFAGTLGNLIAVPIFELGFVLAFVLNIIFMLLPFLTFLLIPISFLFTLTVNISNYLASIDFLIFHGYIPSSIIILFSLLILFVCSGYVMISKKGKRPIILFLSALCLAFCILDLSPKNYNGLTIFKAEYNNSSSTIFVTEQQTFLVSDFKELDYISLYLNQARINKINVVLPASNYNQENLALFEKEFSVSLILNQKEEFQSKNLNVSYLSLLSEKSLPIIEIYGYKSLIVEEKLTKEDTNNLNLLNDFMQFNIVFQSSNTNLKFNADYLATRNLLSSPKIKYNELNNWYFKLNNGKIDFVRSLN